MYFYIGDFRIPVILLIVLAIFIVMMTCAEFMVRANERREKADEIARKRAGLTAVPLLLAMFEGIDSKADGMLDEDELNAASRLASITDQERAAIKYLLANAGKIGHLTERVVSKSHQVVVTPYGGTSIPINVVTNHYRTSETELVAYLDRIKGELADAPPA
jgi:hypothetical protein